MKEINTLHRRFLKICFITVSLSFLLILSYCLLYNHSNNLLDISYYKVIFYHTSIVILLLFGLTALAWPFMGIDWKSQAIQYVYGSLWGVTLTLLVLLYILTFLGNQILNSPLAFDLFLSYLKQLNNLLDTLKIPLWPSYLLLLGVPVLLIALSVSQSRVLWYGSKYVLRKVQRLISEVLSVSGVLRWGFILLLVPVVLYQGYKYQKMSLLARLQYVREPFTLIFFQDRFQDQLYKLLSYPDTLLTKKNYPTTIKFNRKNVILIIVDDLRADYLPLYGYPENTSPWLYTMYKRGSLQKVNYAFSATSMSLGGILSTLRSRTWPLLSMSNFTLPDLLKQQGYNTHFVLSGDHTHFYNLKKFFGDNLDTYFDGSMANGYYFNDDRLLFQGLKQIPDYQKTPSFFYFHMMSVHNLGTRQPEYIKYQPAHATNQNVVTYRNNYKNGIIQMDHHIHQLFDKLATKGYLQNSLVIITADHGESIGENGKFGHWIDVSNNQLHIPLLIYDTDSLITYRTDHAVQADIAATIVDRLGLPIPKTWTGESLLRTSLNKYSYHSVRHYYAVTQYQTGKILKYKYNADTNHESAFDIIIDPAESKNILAELPGQTKSVLRSKLRQYIKEHPLEDNP